MSASGGLMRLFRFADLDQPYFSDWPDLTANGGITMKLVRVVAHVLLGAALFAVTGCGESRKSVEAKYLSLDDVVFRIPDRESLVLPSNYVSRHGAKAAADKDPAAVHLVTNFTLCAKLPEIELRGDRPARSGCLSIGYKGSEQADWLMTDVAITAGANAADLERGLGRIIVRVLSDRNSKPKSQVEYVKANDEYELHSYRPIGPNVRPSTPTVFYRGEFGEPMSRINTLIECAGRNFVSAPPFMWCSHSYSLAVEEVPSWGATVTLTYAGKWLPSWEEIEAKSREKILSLRIQQEYQQGDIDGSDNRRLEPST